MPDPIGRYGEQARSATEDLRTRTVAGAVAGNLAVAGILPGDRLVSVQPVNVAAANLVAEFEVTAEGMINNAGGTSTATQIVLVMWQRSAAGASGYSV